MPYAAKAEIEHEFDVDHLNVWLTFRHPMDQDLKPPLALWLLEEDDNPIDIVDSDWQDEFTLLLTSDTVADPPNRVLLEYNGPNSNLQTTWGKDWEPWGPILSTDIGKAPCMVDRGDPAAWDWDLGDLTTDGAWRDLDLSGIVPEHAKAVALRTIISDNSVSRYFRFRKKGNAHGINVCGSRTQVANITIDADLVCCCNIDRKIQYLASATVWTSIYITVKGWWF